MAQTKTTKVVGLFVAAALTVSGCSSTDESEYDDDCYDADNDGYCDDDGSSRGSGSTYIDLNGKKKYKRNYSGVSSGSSGFSSSGSKGGIGSSGSSSSG